MAHDIGDGEEDIVDDSRVHGARWNGGYCSVELIDELVVLRVRHGRLGCYAHESDAYGLDLLKSIHPGLPRCDWVYRGGGGGAGREKRHGRCSFVLAWWPMDCYFALAVLFTLQWSP